MKLKSLLLFLTFTLGAVSPVSCETLEKNPPLAQVTGSIPQSTPPPARASNRKLIEDQCQPITDEMPGHPPLDFFDSGLTKANCEQCAPATAAGQRDASMDAIVTLVPSTLSQELPLACVRYSMMEGYAFNKSQSRSGVRRFKTCKSGNVVSAKNDELPCITEELAQFNHRLTVETASCFGLRPSHLFPAIHQESRYHSNVQPPGGDTGFGQLTGPFVEQSFRVFNTDSVMSLAQTPQNEAQRRSCAQLDQAYQAQKPEPRARIRNRCNWLNPVGNMVLTAVNFKMMIENARGFISAKDLPRFDANDLETILALVATHAHHMPASHTRFRAFLRNSRFRSMRTPITAEAFKAEYTRYMGRRTAAGIYLRHTLGGLAKANEESGGGSCFGGLTSSSETKSSSRLKDIDLLKIAEPSPTEGAG